MDIWTLKLFLFIPLTAIHFYPQVFDEIGRGDAGGWFHWFKKLFLPSLGAVILHLEVTTCLGLCRNALPPSRLPLREAQQWGWEVGSSGSFSSICLPHPLLAPQLPRSAGRHLSPLPGEGNFICIFPHLTKQDPWCPDAVCRSIISTTPLQVHHFLWPGICSSLTVYTPSFIVS